MVSTRSGGKPATVPVSKAAKPAAKEKPYPKCTKHPNGGVMCASCSRAGMTPSEYAAAYEKHKMTRPMVRPAERRSAPPGSQNGPPRKR